MNLVDEWIVANASVIGPSHQRAGAPCQDASVIQISESGEWVAIVVSDGAGSASHAQEGSSFVAKFFARSLIYLSRELSSKAPGQWINDYVIERIIEARQSLRTRANSDDISKYHCTLVACLLGPNGGFAIHIGDGAIFGGRVGYVEALGEAELNDSFFISPPENGEYSNETYFVTEGNWIKNLRITPMPRLDWVFACTDGGTALSMVSDKEPKEGFIVPVLKEVLNKSNTSDRSATLVDILANPQADKVTGDDKTIAIAFRVSVKKSASALKFQSIARVENNSSTIESGAQVVTSIPITPNARISKNIKRKWSTPIRALAFATACVLVLMLAAFALFKAGAFGYLEFVWFRYAPAHETSPKLPTQTLPKHNEVEGEAQGSSGTRNIEKAAPGSDESPAELPSLVPSSSTQEGNGRIVGQSIRPEENRSKAQVSRP